MNHPEAWTQFFGWYTALNFGLYLITVVAVWTMRDFIARTNARRFGVSEDVVLRVTFTWLAFYKLGILLFALVPWLALKLAA